MQGLRWGSTWRFDPGLIKRGQLNFSLVSQINTHLVTLVLWFGLYIWLKYVISVFTVLVLKWEIRILSIYLHCSLVLIAWIKHDHISPWVFYESSRANIRFQSVFQEDGQVSQVLNDIDDIELFVKFLWTHIIHLIQFVFSLLFLADATAD